MWHSVASVENVARVSSVATVTSVPDCGLVLFNVSECGVARVAIVGKCGGVWQNVTHLWRNLASVANVAVCGGMWRVWRSVP